MGMISYIKIDKNMTRTQNASQYVSTILQILTEIHVILTRIGVIFKSLLLRGGPLDILGGGCQIQKKIHARN